jgi:membrane-anchored protein YejM (alkaline phosphatase superfamily)
MAGKTLRMLAGCWYAILFLLAACGAVFRRHELLRSPLVWGVVLCFTFTAVHAVYWSNMRMRAPLMPMVCLLASLGAVALYERLCRRRS